MVSEIYNNKWIVGSWICQRPSQQERVIIFHADHSWGVERYVPSHEDIRGRRWQLNHTTLTLTYPGDHGLVTSDRKITSFDHDEFELDETETYTRKK